jgi:hypothetical protein
MMTPISRRARQAAKLLILVPRDHLLQRPSTFVYSHVSDYRADQNVPNDAVPNRADCYAASCQPRPTVAIVHDFCTSNRSCAPEVIHRAAPAATRA